MGVNLNKGDFFLDKNTLKLYVFDGKIWLEIAASSKLIIN